MSLKAYDAFLFTPTTKDPWAELMLLRHRLLQRACVTIMDTAALLVVGGANGLRRVKDPATQLIRTCDLMHELYRRADASPVADIFDLNVSLTVRFSRGLWVLRLYAGVPMYKAMMRACTRDPTLSDFHYQNQSDRPRHITVKEWKRRGEWWDQVLADDDCEWDWLTMEVVSLGAWYRIQPSFGLWLPKERKATLRAWAKALKRAKEQTKGITL